MFEEECEVKIIHRKQDKYVNILNVHIRIAYGKMTGV